MNTFIVIIGAARSGTKILRDVLAEATGLPKVAYDVGFVWRYRNESIPHDVLDPATASPRVKRFVEQYLRGHARTTSGAPTAKNAPVIEKTVGNTLRVPFVEAVLPDVRFVHLVRNGIDAVESSHRQWTTPVDRSYLVQKAKQFPFRLVGSYGRKYARDQIAMRLRQRGGDLRPVSSWGPRYPGIDADIDSVDLLTVCARQWRRSVEQAGADLRDAHSPVVGVRYEDLVTQPEQTITSMIARLGLTADHPGLQQAVSRLKPDRAGAGSASLAAEDLAIIDAEIGPTLTGLGYGRVTSVEAGS